jgi:hypothetical protein
MRRRDDPEHNSCGFSSTSQQNAFHFEIPHRHSAISEHDDAGDLREIHQTTGRGMLDIGDRNGYLASLASVQCEFAVEAILELVIMRAVMHPQYEREIDLAGIAEVKDQRVRFCSVSTKRVGSERYPPAPRTRHGFRVPFSFRAAVRHNWLYRVARSTNGYACE